MQLRQQASRLDTLGIRVVVVTFDDSAMARTYVQQTELPWPMLCDKQRELYKAYGMERGDWWSIYGPASIWNYLKLIFGRGRRIQRPGRDFRQFGGNVLIDPNGIVRFHFVSQSPHDRPSVEELLAPWNDANGPKHDEGIKGGGAAKSRGPRAGERGRGRR